LQNAATQDKPEVNPAGQPLRKEVEFIISQFLMPGAAHELNVSPSMRSRTITTARRSTHPDAFKEIAEAAYHLMESSSIPNFVKYATSNINGPKKKLWLYVGIADFLIGLLIYFLCIFLRVI
jgi:Regulator of G protein signaling domain